MLLRSPNFGRFRLSCLGHIGFHTSVDRFLKLQGMRNNHIE